MVEPKYYNKNGLSPIRAFQQGLISTEEYIGFCKGNVIKYTVRVGDKDSVDKDIDKAIEYLEFLRKALKKQEKKKEIKDNWTSNKWLECLPYYTSEDDTDDSKDNLWDKL